MQTPNTQPSGESQDVLELNDSRVSDEAQLINDTRSHVADAIPGFDRIPTNDEIFREWVLGGMQQLDNPYHNNTHAGEVIDRSDRLVRHMVPEATADDIENIRIAALYHDAGHAGVTVRGTSPRNIPRKDLSNEQFAVQMMRQDLGPILDADRLNIIEGLILSTTFGQTPHPHPPTTPLEKIIVLADIGGFRAPFDAWVKESLLVLEESAPSALPADFDAWRKNRVGFLDGYVRGLVTQAQPHLDPEEYAAVVRDLDTTLTKVRGPEFDTYRGAFDAVRDRRIAA